MPSPTYQCIKLLLSYNISYLLCCLFSRCLQLSLFISIAPSTILSPYDCFNLREFVFNFKLLRFQSQNFTSFLAQCKVLIPQKCDIPPLRTPKALTMVQLPRCLYELSVEAGRYNDLTVASTQAISFVCAKVELSIKVFVYGMILVVSSDSDEHLSVNLNWLVKVEIDLPIILLIQLYPGSSIPSFSHSLYSCSLSYPTTNFQESEWKRPPKPMMKLQGSTMVSDMRGEGRTMLIQIGFLCRLLVVMIRSKRRLVNPDPVPPDIEQFTMTPSKCSHPSSILPNLSSHASTISFPIVQCPLTQLFEESSLPVMLLEALYNVFLGPTRTSSTTSGDVSINRFLGTCLPS